MQLDGAVTKLDAVHGAMSGPSFELPTEARELYGLPLEEFTTRRNALAKELKAAGNAETAALVGSLKKPKRSAWVVNTLARVERDIVDSLLELADRMSAGGSRVSIREATDRRHDLVRRLMKRAEATLSEGGRNPSAATLEEVRRTLYAAVDDDDRELLRSGTLTEPIEASGFGREWSPDEETAPAPELSAADMKRHREIERLEKSLGEAEEAANSAAAAADRARRELTEAEARETRARAKVDRLRNEIAHLG